MVFVYIIRSKRTERSYVGLSDNPKRRLSEHNRGKVFSTRAYRPWQLIHTECYPTLKEALEREKYLKSYKGVKEKRKIVNNISCRVV